MHPEVIHHSSLWRVQRRHCSQRLAPCLLKKDQLRMPVAHVRPQVAHSWYFDDGHPGTGPDRQFRWKTEHNIFFTVPSLRVWYGLGIACRSRPGVGQHSALASRRAHREFVVDPHCTPCREQLSLSQRLPSVPIRASSVVLHLGLDRRVQVDAVVGGH